MGSLLDTISSLVIGGIVVLMLTGLMLNMRSAANNQTAGTNVQHSATTVGEILEHDLAKAGFNVRKPPADSAIVYAGPDSLILRGDFTNSGTVSVLRYYLGKSKPANNVNPRTRYLYRDLNGKVRVINDGVTTFRCTYYDGAGTILPTAPSVARPSSVGAIRIAINFESTYPSEIISGKKADSTFAYARWDEVIKPRNMR